MDQVGVGGRAGWLRSNWTKFLCGAGIVLYLHGGGWWSCEVYCQKEQASNSGLCRTFPKGSHYLITWIFILHLLFTVYYWTLILWGWKGCGSIPYLLREGSPMGVDSNGQMENPCLLEFSADAFLTIPPLNKTQPWESRRKWALLRRASLGSEDVGPETPGISSSNWTLILWPELVKHLEGTLGLNFSSSQHELSSYCFLHLQNVWLLPQGEDVNSCQTVSHIIFYLDGFNSCGIIPPFLLQLSEIPNEKLATDLGAFSLSI